MARKPARSYFAVSLSNFHNDQSTQSIAGTAVVSRIASVLNLKVPIDPKQKLSDLGSGLENWDLALKLMGYPPFYRDGLILQKQDVENVSTVGALGDLVFGWYRQNGWSVQ